MHSQRAEQLIIANLFYSLREPYMAIYNIAIIWLQQLCFHACMQQGSDGQRLAKNIHSFVYTEVSRVQSVSTHCWIFVMFLHLRRTLNINSLFVHVHVRRSAATLLACFR